MTSKSKAKGNRFEYEIRDLLNKIYDTKEFARTPGSGAIMGRGNFAKRQGLSEDVQNTLGSDLICPAWFPYSVEAKNYGDSPVYHTILSGDDPKLTHWLGEACFDAKNLNKIPLLFFKTTRKGAYVAFPSLLALDLPLQYSLNHNEFTIIGIDHFVANKDHFKACAERLDSVVDWMATSSRVSELLTFIDEASAKKKAAKTKKSKSVEENV